MIVSLSSQINKEFFDTLSKKIFDTELDEIDIEKATLHIKADSYKMLLTSYYCSNKVYEA